MPGGQNDLAADGPAAHAQPSVGETAYRTIGAACYGGHLATIERLTSLVVA